MNGKPTRISNYQGVTGVSQIRAAVHRLIDKDVTPGVSYHNDLGSCERSKVVFVRNFNPTNYFVTKTTRFH
ncbi:hypothetical protein PoB_006380000 [Plakobranchus ocellatus]|uniref:Uncharacterized protein n=1 Tax=Plakobranchus ocellatus TaxID=259542 RepID=A0AAV4CZP3_9GAST|nr:hypothetical protein PoB_006380000 [Plakobranchus ocellatus]